MKLIHKKRLLKLAKHLRSGKLGHKQFNFNRINADADQEEMNYNGCGAMGCAIGECPIAFPKQWEFRKGQPAVKGIPRSRYGNWDSLERHSIAFFGLTEREVQHLFAPDAQLTFYYGGRNLSRRAKPHSVAANIEAFVKRKEKESK